MINSKLNFPKFDHYHPHRHRHRYHYLIPLFIGSIPSLLLFQIVPDFF